MYLDAVRGPPLQLDSAQCEDRGSGNSGKIITDAKNDNVDPLVSGYLGTTSFSQTVTRI